MSSSDKLDLNSMAPSELMKLFPEARLTIRDRIPTNMLLLYTFLNINKTISNIKFSTDEIRESILALVAMIPDELRDEQFIKELNAARKEILMDVRPVFCTVKASVEYCERKGIPAFIKEHRIEYFKMYHAVFDLLMRKGMLMRTETTETFSDMIVPEKEGNKFERS